MFTLWSYLATVGPPWMNRGRTAVDRPSPSTICKGSFTPSDFPLRQRRNATLTDKMGMQPILAITVSVRKIKDAVLQHYVDIDVTVTLGVNRLKCVECTDVIQVWNLHGVVASVVTTLRVMNEPLYGRWWEKHPRQMWTERRHVFITHWA